MHGSWPFSRGRTATVINMMINPRNQERTGDPDRTAVVDGCGWNPGATSGTTIGGVQVQQSPRLYGPYDLDIDPNATIIVDDVDGEWYVDGEVLRWRNDLTGRETCCEVPLTRTRGAR